MKKLEIGDRVTIRTEQLGTAQGVVVDLSEDNKVAKVFLPVENDSGQFSLSIIERHPRPMELIEVWDGEDWVWRRAVSIDGSGGVYACSSSDAIKYYTNWRFMNKDSRVKELVKKIEDNDHEVLEELAEIILAAREKVTT